MANRIAGENDPAGRRPWVVAHRGFRARCPENTLAAFRAAIAAGADMIELDVTLSRDRQPVVIHDDTLDRTTDGHGPVADFTTAQLKTLDAGRWYDSAFAGEPIPLLSEVMPLIKGRIQLNIEIKPTAVEDPAPEDAIERQVVAMTQRCSILESVIISSFDWRCIQRISRLAVKPRLALLSDRTRIGDLLQAADKTGAFSWHPNHRRLTAADAAAARAAGLKVLPYTVNTVEAIGRCLAIGVDGIITDDPRLALGIANRRQAPQ